MSLTDLAPVVDALLRPWSRRLAGHGLSAGMVTVAGTAVCLGLAATVLVSKAPWPTMWLLIVALAARLAALRLQALLVQEQGRGSLTGRLLDVVCRPLSEVALLWPLALVKGIDARLVTLCCLLTLLTEFAGLAVTVIGAERRVDGPMDGCLRAVALAGVCLLLGLGVGPGWWTRVWFQVLPLLLGWTIFRRLREGLKQVVVVEPVPGAVS